MKVRRFLCVLLSVALLAVSCAVPVMADDGNKTGDFTVENGVLTKYNGGGGAVVIPDDVTGIGDDVFAGNSDITSITIPSSVTSIGNEAFLGCDNITSIDFSKCKALTIGNAAFLGTGISSVTIPKTVTSIGEAAFACNKLMSITVSEDNQNYCSQDGALFSKDKSILLQYPVAVGNTSYSIPDGVTEVMASSFQGGANLISITLPAGLQKIDNSAFAGTGITSIALPDSVSFIDVGAFSCEHLKTITVGNNKNYTVENGALFNADKTTLVLYPAGSESTSFTVPASVTTIGESAFDSAKNLQTVNVADSGKLSSLANAAFVGCAGLTSISLPDAVTKIGESAFQDCTSLSSFTVPAKVTEINDGMFAGCTGLKSVVIPDTVTNISKAAFDHCSGFTIYCHSGSYAEAYAKSNNIPIADSSLKAITSFSLDNVAGTINETNHTIALTLPSGTKLTALSPAITVSDGAAVSPTSLTATDFTKPVTYTVTAKDGSTQDYKVTVSLAKVPTTASIGVNYSVFIKGYNWLSDVKDGAQAGIQGKKLTIQALKVKLTGKKLSGASIIYQAFVQNKGWQSVVSNGKIAGTTGKSLGVEALRITLKGLDGYSVQYRVHVQGKNWTAWQTTKNNTAIGSAAIAGGKSTKIESVEIVVKKVK